MSFTLKDIKGAVVEKLPLDRYGSSDDDYVAKCCAEHGNAIIDEQANVKLRFNREKLADILMGWELNDYQTALACAKTIIAADKDIVEVEK